MRLRKLKREIRKSQELRYWIYFIAVVILASFLIWIFFRFPFLSGLRAFFGFTYVLFIPGYVVVRLFFNEVDIIEKAALSFGLSIALVILSIMLSNMVLKIPITTLNNFLVLLAVIIITFTLKSQEARFKNLVKNIKGTNGQ